MTGGYTVKPKADRDLHDYADYLAREASLELALRFLAAAHETFALLATHPNIGWSSRLKHDPHAGIDKNCSERGGYVSAPRCQLCSDPVKIRVAFVARLHDAVNVRKRVYPWRRYLPSRMYTYLQGQVWIAASVA